MENIFIDKKFKKYLNSPIVIKGINLQNYQDVKVNCGDKHFSEKLINIKKLGIAGKNYYYSLWNPPYYHRIPGSISCLLLRENIAKKLRKINNILVKSGLEVYVFDAYRPQAVQNYFYNNWIPCFLRKKYPHKSKDWIKKQTGLYWAMGASTYSNVVMHTPPHSTGSAVDMTLRRIETKQLLEMGGMFDDISPKSRPDYFENLGKSKINGFTEMEAMRNRRLLYNLMIAEGFVGHPREWWHFSCGDKKWAKVKGRSSAYYGYAGNMVGEKLPIE